MRITVQRSWRTIAAAAVIGGLAISASVGAAGAAPAKIGKIHADGVAEAKRLLAQQERPVKWVAPGPPIEVGSKVKGKTMFYIANGISLPFVQSYIAGVKEAVAAVGMKVVVTGGAGDTSLAARLIQQAIGRKADIIVLHSWDSAALTAPIKAAKDAGILVITSLDRDPRLPNAKDKEVGIRGLAGYCYGCVGRQVADFIVADSNGTANTVVFDVPDTGIAKHYVAEFMSEMKRLCPKCKTQKVNAPVSQWATGLASLTSSVVKANPTTKLYLFPLYDGMVASMKPSVYAANAQDRVKIVSYNASLPDMQAIKKGNDIEIADVGGSSHWAGWATVDQALRVLLGKPPLADEKIPGRTFDLNNIKSIDLTKDEATWYGPSDFRANYRKLWGLG